MFLYLVIYKSEQLAILVTIIESVVLLKAVVNILINIVHLFLPYGLIFCLNSFYHFIVWKARQMGQVNI